MPTHEDMIAYTQYVEDQSMERYGIRIPQDMVHREWQNANVFFGCRSTKDGSICYIGKPQDKDGHVLVVGGAGSGKSSCIAIPIALLFLPPISSHYRNPCESERLFDFSAAKK